MLVSQEAYRIVQEGLTNALKHSADRSVILELSATRDVIAIKLVSRSAGRRSRNAGRGLHGISERAATLGGTVRAGAHNGRWTLSVILPTSEAPA